MLGQCRSDLNPTQCFACFTQARQLLSRCLPKVAGRIFLDGCFLRYDNYGFFKESLDNSHDMKVCESSTTSPLENNNNNNNETKSEFRKKVSMVISNVTKRAGKHKFAAQGGNDVFALAQCWQTLDKEGCERCLREAGKRVEECAPVSDEGRGLFAGCFLRYSTRKFYNDIKEDEIQGYHSE